MSYASVAHHNAPPPSQQPHADTSLLNTERSFADNVADDGAKVNVVAHDFKTNAATLTSQARENIDQEYDDLTGTSDKKRYKKKANKRFQEAEAEGEYIWDVTKQYLLRPGVAGGLIGLGAFLRFIEYPSPVLTITLIVNIGIIASVGRAYYTQPHLRRDTTIIGSTIAGALALLSVEGYAAEKYSQTPAGKEEARRAKEEGAALYKHAHEIVLRPGVLGGLVGLGLCIQL